MAGGACTMALKSIRNTKDILRRFCGLNSFNSPHVADEKPRLRPLQQEAVQTLIRGYEERRL
jgi:hypothetical protein